MVGESNIHARRHATPTAAVPLRATFPQAAVFCNRKSVAEWLARRVASAGFPAAYLGADLPQAERVAAMEDVRAFRCACVLVWLAARACVCVCVRVCVCACMKRDAQHASLFLCGGGACWCRHQLV